MNRTAASAPMNDLYKSLSILYRKSHVWLNESCSKLSITAAQATIILVVCDNDCITQDEVTKRTGLDKSVVARITSKLESSGYLTRATNALDKRTYDILPTEKARSVYPQIQEALDRYFAKTTGCMSSDEQGEFHRLLVKASQAALK